MLTPTVSEISDWFNFAKYVNVSNSAIQTIVGVLSTDLFIQK